MHEDNPKLFHGDPSVLFSKERVERLEIKRVVRLALEGLDIRSVLDVGTGGGLFALAFAQKGLAVAGMDVNPQMLEIARQFAAEAKFCEGKAEALPFSDGEFDLVFMGQLLHESETPLKVLEESKRVAKLRVVILESPYIKEDIGPPIEHRLKPEQVESLAKKAGFSNVETIPLSHMMLFRLTS